MTDAMRAEIETAQKAQHLLTANGFVPLAEAARLTDVPLSTLADAARSGRLPAVKVQSRRWLVRVPAVRLLFGKSATADEDAVERQLVRRGIIADRGAAPKRLERIKPEKVDGKSVSQIVLEDRR